MQNHIRLSSERNICLGVMRAYNVYGGERAWVYRLATILYIFRTHDHTFLKIHIKNHRIASYCLHDVTTKKKKREKKRERLRGVLL